MSRGLRLVSGGDQVLTWEAIEEKIDRLSRDRTMAAFNEISNGKMTPDRAYSLWLGMHALEMLRGELKRGVKGREEL